MDKIYLNESICNSIRSARLAQGLTSCSVASMVGHSPSWLSRVEHCQTVYIHKDEASALEKILDITIPMDVDNESLKELYNLREENRRLKDLLMEKWKSQEVKT